MEDIRTSMTDEGRRRYNQYIRVYERKQNVEDVLDACYYGLMTEEEATSRIRQGDETKKDCMPSLVGLHCLSLRFGLCFLFMQ